MTLLFMKIDANSDGTVSWDEFSTFMMTGTKDDDHEVITNANKLELCFRRENQNIITASKRYDKIRVPDN